MSHTPEPWIFFKDRSNRVVVWPSTNYTVASCFITPEIDCCEANARRIVAAVNACAGIETYALELMTGELSLLNQITHKPQENSTKKAAQYRKQRDELLAALELIMERMELPPDTDCYCHISPPCHDCVENSGIREAIELAESTLAEVKGTKP